MAEYTQHEREQLVASILDQSVEDWNKFINSDEALKYIVGTDQEHLVVQMYQGLSGGEGTYQVYLQAISLSSDESLGKILDAMGKNPLGN